MYDKTIVSGCSSISNLIMCPGGDNLWSVLVTKVACLGITVNAN
jgi:hypothetical protein